MIRRLPLLAAVAVREGRGAWRGGLLLTGRRPIRHSRTRLGRGAVVSDGEPVAGAGHGLDEPGARGSVSILRRRLRMWESMVRS